MGECIEYHEKLLQSKDYRSYHIRVFRIFGEYGHNINIIGVPSALLEWENQRSAEIAAAADWNDWYSIKRFWPILEYSKNPMPGITDIFCKDYMEIITSPFLWNGKKGHEYDLLINQMENVIDEMLSEKLNPKGVHCAYD